MERFYLPKAFQIPKDYNPPTDEELKSTTRNPQFNSKYYRYKVSSYEKPKTLLPCYSSIVQSVEGLFLLATNSYTTTVFDGTISATYDFNNIISSSLENSEFNTVFKENLLDLLFLEEILFATPTSSNSIKLYRTKPECVYPDYHIHRNNFFLHQVSNQWTDGNVCSLDKIKIEKRVILGTSKGHFDCYEYGFSDFQLVFHIDYGHLCEVTGISTHPNLNRNWVSCSSDKSCTLWDKRLLYPASSLIKLHKDRLTYVKWLTEDSIIAADSAGNILFLDVRKPENILNQVNVVNRPIKSLCFKNDEKTFGVLSESCNTKIYQLDQTDNVNLIYEHNSHPTIPYSMCWDIYEKPNTFYLVGPKRYAKEIEVSDK